MADEFITAGPVPAKRLSADDFAERCISDLDLHEPASIRRLAALAPTEIEEREFMAFADQMEGYING